LELNRNFIVIEKLKVHGYILFTRYIYLMVSVHHMGKVCFMGLKAYGKILSEARLISDNWRFIVGVSFSIRQGIH